MNLKQNNRENEKRSALFGVVKYFLNQKWTYYNLMFKRTSTCGWEIKKIYLL